MKVKKFGKGAFAVLLTILLMFSAFPICAGAVENTSDFEYYVKDDGTAEITDYNGSEISLIIPSEIDGYSVTSIGNLAFSDCTNLTSITIPDSVTSIGSSAFSGCTSLTSITIPDSVSSIVSSTFSGCTSLENINVGSNNAYYSSDNGILFNKDKTELVAFPAGKSLTEYTISESVTSISDYAYFDCTNLASITIPNSVTSIGSHAFCYCTSLTSIIIPDSVTSVGDSAFWNCTSLTSVINPDNLTIIADGMFWNCTSLTSVTIPDSVTSIGNYAFSDCKSLKSITIPERVTSIGWRAFEGCTSLTSVTIPDSVTSISSYAFEGCTSLTSVTIPDSVTEIGYLALGYIYDSENKVNGFTIYGTAGTEAERYATDNGFTFVALDNENYIHSDSNSGISVIAKADADLTVSEITDEHGISDANTLLGGTETVKNLYDISLTKDGEKVQHEGMAEVKIPCDNENAKIYRVESDNTLTDMNAVYTDGNLVFHTEHFSLYIVAEEKKETETVGDMNNDGKIDVTDVTAIQIELAKAGTDYYDTVADTDKDGKVDVADVTFLQQFIASTVTVL